MNIKSILLVITAAFLLMGLGTAQAKELIPQSSTNSMAAQEPRRLTAAEMDTLTAGHDLSVVITSKWGSMSVPVFHLHPDINIKLNLEVKGSIKG